ncbi:PorV/PorQ family protein [bacterium]|nr:PorV/PorQ family protein [bacterium]
MSKRWLLTAVLLFAASVTTRAEFDWVSKYAGDFLSGQANARLLALGGVGVAVPEGPAGVHANPALLARNTRQGVSLMHADRFGGEVMMDYLAYVHPTQEGRALGFGLIRQGVDDIPVTYWEQIGEIRRPRVTEMTSASEYAFQVGYGTESRYGQIGAVAKLLYKRLYENNAYGLGIDVGYARDFGRLTVGAQARDVLSTILAWDTGRTETIAPAARIGAAYTIIMQRQNTELMPVVELQARGESLDDDDALALHAGLEVRISKVVMARVGYDDERLAYGAGLRVGPAAVDYAFVGHSDLGNTHRVSIAWFWGQI